MPTGEQFITNAPQAFTTTPLGPGATSIPVTSFSGWPGTPFTAVLGIGTSLQEAIYVTSIVGTNATVTRGYDGTTAQNHPTNQTITHATVGVHFREPRSHIDSAGPVDASSEAVHGLTNVVGNVVVGSAQTQTLTNKTLPSPVISGTVTGSATYATPGISGTITSGAGSLTLPTTTDTLVGRATTDTLTNKTLDTPTFTGNPNMGPGQWIGTGDLRQHSLSFSGILGANVQTSTFTGTTGGGPPVSGSFPGGAMVLDSAFNSLWVTPAGGAPGSWSTVGGTAVLNRTVVSVAAASIPVNIPTWANNIDVYWSGRSSAAVTGDPVGLRLNGDTTNSYLWQQNEYNGTTATPAISPSLTSFIRVGLMAGGSSTAGFAGTGSFRISSCQGTTLSKIVAGHGTAFSSAGISWAGVYGGIYTPTTAMTSITLLLPSGANFQPGTTVTVYAT